MGSGMSRGRSWRRSEAHAKREGQEGRGWSRVCRRRGTWRSLASPRKDMDGGVGLEAAKGGSGAGPGQVASQDGDFDCVRRSPRIGLGALGRTGPEGQVQLLETQARKAAKPIM